MNPPMVLLPSAGAGGGRGGLGGGRGEARGGEGSKLVVVTLPVA